jgi:hypothetical protein
VQKTQGESSLSAGERALYSDGNLREARKWFDAAYTEAERDGDGQAMARAALGLSGLWAHEHRTAADAVKVRARQLDALALIDPGSSLALRLRIRMAAEGDYRTGGHTALLGLVAEARRDDDPVALAEALSLAHHCLLSPEHRRLRRELAEELIGEATRTARRSDLLMGLLWLAVDLLLSADPQAERQLLELRALLSQQEHLAVGFVLSTIEVMLSIRAGRFAEAEKLAAASAERGAAAGDVTATGCHTAQIGMIRWYQGRVAELIPTLADLVNSPLLSVLDNTCNAGLAVAAATAGDRRLATGIMARLHNRLLADSPRQSSWMMPMFCLVEAAHLLSDAETAARAYHLLLPFADLPAMLTFGAVCLGSVHHCLGVASLTCGEVDRAVEHLRLSVDRNLALGHWPAVVMSRFRLGQALILRDGPGDEDAQKELALAAQEAAGLGMVLPSDAVETDPAEAQVSCRRRGRQWEIELRGRTVSVEHCVGMQHLAILFANPGREISALDLAAGPALTGAEANSAGVSPQLVLDDLAKREYKQRLEQLQADIDELEAAHDTERAAAVRAERDWLITELAAATGFAGRGRRFADSEERARISVGKAIRRALTRITETDPILGRELRATVQTGLNCCYRPR